MHPEVAVKRVFSLSQQRKMLGMHNKKGSNDMAGAVAHLSCVEELTLHVRVPVTDRGDRLHFGHLQILNPHTARQPTSLAAPIA